MATLHASIWLLVKERAPPSEILDKYVTVYREHERSQFAWLFMYFAVQAHHIDLIRELLVPNAQLRTKLGIHEAGYPIPSKDMATAMNEAVRKNFVDVVEVVLAVYPSLATEPGIIFAQNPRVRFSLCPVELAIIEDRVEALQILMKHYAGETMGSEGRYPLHIATIHKSPKSLEYLLSLEGCREQINAKDSEGWTCLLLAAMYQPQFIPVLIQHNLDVFVTQGEEKQNALQILCSGCIMVQSSRTEESDPCPTLQSYGRVRSMAVINDLLYITPDIVQLGKLLMERGLDINDKSRPPLRIFCNNIRRKLQDLLGDETNCSLYKEAINFFASVTEQSIVDSSLMLLCHQLQFLCSQLRRSSDYDNIVRHIDMMEFVRDCITILLDNGANPNTSEPADMGEKRLRGLQYLIPYSLPCAVQLKDLLTRECQKTPPVDSPSATYSPLDVVLVTLLVLFPLQLEEPEMHQRGMKTLLEVFMRLCRLGCKCNQPAQFFLALCIDPQKHEVFLETYLESQSQSEHHDIVEKLLAFGDHEVFSGIQKQLSSSLVRMFSLKDLLRKDIIRLLGSTKCPDKVRSLPIPETLKFYLMAFWEVDPLC